MSILIFYHYVPRETVNIYAPLAENVDAMMSIQYSSIRPCFQTTLQSRE
jgi:hypothetical protein